MYRWVVVVVVDVVVVVVVVVDVVRVDVDVVVLVVVDVVRVVVVFVVEAVGSFVSPFSKHHFHLVSFHSPGVLRTTTCAPWRPTTQQSL